MPPSPDRGQHDTPARRIREALGGVMAVPVARSLLAFVVAGLTYVTVAGGLIVVWPAAQVAVIVGIAVGLVAPRASLSAAIALISYGLGALVAPDNYFFVGDASMQPLRLLPWSVLAAAAAFAVTALVSRRIVPGRIIMWMAVGLIVVNLWGTTLKSDNERFVDDLSGQTVPSVIELLDGATPPPAIARTDDYYYARIYARMRQGQGYYAASTAAYGDVDPNGLKGPSGVLNVRQPLLATFIASLPGSWWVVGALLLLISSAALSVPAVHKGALRAPLTIPGVAAVAAYSIPFLTSLQLFYAEIWAGNLAVLALAAYGVSLRTERWRRWLGLAVAAAACATLIREMAAVLLVAGIVGALLGPRSRRRWQALAWCAGILAAGTSYVFHAIMAQPYLTGVAGQNTWGRGGLAFSAAALVYNTLGFGLALAVPIVLAVLSYLGAAFLGDRGLRGFAVVSLCAPLVVYLFVGNGAQQGFTGMPVNYWGALLLPMAFACLPAALAVLPQSVAPNSG